MFRRWFFDHPSSVGETYLEHQKMALGFSASLFAAAAACLIHALVPGLFQRTGSTVISRLHDRMVVHRRRAEAYRGESREPGQYPPNISSVEN